MAPTTKKLTILCPVRNEGMNIRIMIKILKAVVEVPYEVVVVYDDPHDTTVNAVKDILPDHSNVRFVQNTRGRGVVNALRTGVASARGEFVLIFAADEVGPVLAIKEMLELAEQGCDFVSCTRYAHGGRRLGGSLVGGILSRLANRMFNFMSGSRLTDSTTGIKLFRPALFQSWELTSRPVGWSVAFELSLRAQLSGVRMGEVPIISIDRLYGGKSTFRLGPWFWEYLRWFIWGVPKIRKARGQSTVMVRTTDYFQGKAA